MVAGAELGRFFTWGTGEAVGIDTLAVAIDSTSSYLTEDRDDGALMGTSIRW